jgi:hypothetical protein
MSLPAELTVAEGVDAGVDLDQHATCKRSSKHRESDPNRRQLPTGYHAVLPLREHLDRNSGHFVSQADMK